jgi:3-deoxy-D-manno-octulosonate 8-phosphate phosphatase (KDO 8-P phosphatase)
VLDGPELQARAAAIALALFDVDGVLTDGRVVIHANGSESKTFNIRDGIAMVWAQRAGVKVGFLSARASPTTPHRAAQLGVTIVHHGVRSKIETYEQILAELHLADEQVLYMGDDIVDLAVLGRAGVSAAPADAVAEVRAFVDYVAPSAGGCGAARDALEMVLRAQHAWEAVVAGYAGERSAVRP